MAEFEYYVSPTWENEDANGNINQNAPALSAGNLQKMSNAIANALPRTGGEMTGQLVMQNSIVLKGDPTIEMEPATKKYADENIICITGSDKNPTLSSNGSYYVGTIPGWKDDYVDKYIPIVIIYGTSYYDKGVIYLNWNEWASMENSSITSPRVLISRNGYIYISNENHSFGGVAPSIDCILLFPCLQTKLI